MTMAFFEAAYAASEQPLRLIDADPDLFAGVAGVAAQRAAGDLAIALLRLPAGRWRAPATGNPEGLGLLVLDGLLSRTVAVVDGQRRSELVGAGDLICPWADDQRLAAFPHRVGWEVLEPTRAAILDTAFVRGACRLPGVLPRLVARAVERSQRLALQLAIGDVRRIDDRVMALFGPLADRWGKVTRDGIHVRLPLTHELIAELVGAKRPTVTSSVSELGRAGRLIRRPDRTWLLPATAVTWSARTEERSWSS